MRIQHQRQWGRSVNQAQRRRRRSPEGWWKAWQQMLHVLQPEVQRVASDSYSSISAATSWKTSWAKSDSSIAYDLLIEIMPFRCKCLAEVSLLKRRATRSVDICKGCNENIFVIQSLLDPVNRELVFLCTFHSAFSLSIGWIFDPVNSFSGVPCASPDRELTVSALRVGASLRRFMAEQTANVPDEFINLIHIKKPDQSLVADPCNERFRLAYGFQSD